MQRAHVLGDAVGWVLLAAVAASLLGVPRAGERAAVSVVGGRWGWAIAWAALAALRRRTLDMKVLMTMAALGAVAIREYAEAAWVLVLLAVGTTLETLALDRRRRSVGRGRRAPARRRPRRGVRAGRPSACRVTAHGTLPARDRDDCRDPVRASHDVP